MADNKINWKNHFVELIVVIFGISIAFAIDKYAERVKEQDEMVLSLRSFADDLERDIRNFGESQIPSNQRRVDELNVLIEKLRSEELESDSLGILVRRMFSSSNSRITVATYESLKSSGKLEDIPNVELRRKIVSHYENNYKQSDYISDVNTDYYDRLLTYVSEHSSALFDGNFGDKKLLTDPGFRSMVARWEDIVSFKVKEYKRMMASSQEVLDAIKEELK